MKCKCVCVMGHARPGRPGRPGGAALSGAGRVVCTGVARLVVVSTNRAVDRTPMCVACGTIAQEEAGFVRLESLHPGTAR